MENNKNKYENSEITITFSPRKCIHSANCVKELSEVFRTSVIPWINLEGSTTEKIKSQIKRCPSGALSYCSKSRNKSA